ncbi:SCP2 sterol-binding domain-containing protein [uncultured Amphritea sp.]|uniref:SCP2 sterol-binding domain-containing protein n=1 Tax=Amphritea sp. TaxID=1872502 RepID=UPI001DB22AA6|nr:SCP2 sterol-binding domain-containing protein [uncultured Amphritea sp.]MBR9867228.1 SCP2 sterol-binding domain-containing protein [Oceanospirillales bacterium]MBR9887393.1 SCP2 sterol-binding domain-containing protein [Oceanospirillales bacterium]
MSDAITVTRVIEKLSSRFIPENTTAVVATFQFLLSDADDFYFSIANQQLTVALGEHQDPDITLITNSDTFIRVVTGEKDGMSAYLTGKLRAEGNVMLATQLGKYFSKEKRS